MTEHQLSELIRNLQSGKSQIQQSLASIQFLLQENQKAAQKILQLQALLTKSHEDYQCLMESNNASNDTPK